MGDYKIFFQNHLRGLASRIMVNLRQWYHTGKIIEYKHLLSLKRYLDDFNYIKFLNVHSV